MKSGTTRLGRLMREYRRTPPIRDVRWVAHRISGIGETKLRRFELGEEIPSHDILKKFCEVLGATKDKTEELLKVHRSLQLQSTTEEEKLRELESDYGESFHITRLPQKPHQFTSYFKLLGNRRRYKLKAYRQILHEGLRRFPTEISKRHLYSTFAKNIIGWAKDFRRDEYPDAANRCIDEVTEIINQWDKEWLPKDARYWDLTSQLAQWNERFSDALEFLRTAVQVAEQDENASEGYTQSLRNRQRRLEMRTESKTKDSRGSVDIAFSEIESLVANKKYDDALIQAQRAQDKAIAVGSIIALARSHAYLGLCDARLGSWEEAREQFDMAKFLVPRDQLIKDLEYKTFEE